MNHPSQEVLLGYVLGALDAREHDQIQQLIDNDPEIEEQLLEIKNSMLPLEYIDDRCGPPVGLARRTCEFVANVETRCSEGFHLNSFLPDSFIADVASSESNHPTQTNRSDQTTDSDRHGSAHNVKSPITDLDSISLPSSMPPSNPSSPFSNAAQRDRRVSRQSSWSHTDFLAIIAAVAILAGLLFPALSYSRFQSQILHCQKNLAAIGSAFQVYSNQSIDGRFPEIPADDKLGVSGSFAPLLKNSGLIDYDIVLVCPGDNVAAGFQIPSLNQIKNADGEQLYYLQRIMGGSYGHALGFYSGNRYQTRRNQGRTNILLLADKPSFELEGRISNSHGSSGQNCLFEDGHVAFVRGPVYGCDAIYENDLGYIGCGTHESDNVIAASHVHPMMAEISRLSIPIGPVD